MRAISRACSRKNARKFDKLTATFVSTAQMWGDGPSGLMLCMPQQRNISLIVLFGEFCNNVFTITEKFVPSKSLSK